jgi:hypothetical protein
MDRNSNVRHMSKIMVIGNCGLGQDKRSRFR